MAAKTEKSDLTRQAMKWLTEAEADKARHRTWINDAYRYTMPWRVRQGQSQQPHDQDDLFDPTAIEAVSDFAADMQNTFTPTESPWLEVEPAETLQAAAIAQIKGPLKAYRDSVFSEIKRSNFYEASQEAYPDLAVGTAAMCIQSLDLNDPLHCQAIPITDLLIGRGVYGGVDFRARCLRVRAGDLQYTYPTAKIPPSVASTAKSSPGNMIEVKECVWRLRDKPGVERWQYVLLIANLEADSDIFEGEGSCPIIVARWKTDSTTAWGVGSLYVTMPTIKTLDQLCYLILKHLNRVVDPATYGAESANLDQGIIPGTHIPLPENEKINILESGQNFELGFFEVDAMQTAIKRSLFQDKPDQRGKTPPTASQWLDENARIDRRMGAPVGRLVTEWQLAVFARFKYLLAKRGVLPEVKLNGQDVRLRPQSPLIRSQRQQDVVIADHLLELIGQRFGPQAVAMIVDLFKTTANMKDRLGADIVELRDEQQVQKLLESLAAMAAQQVSQQAAGGAQGQAA